MNKGAAARFLGVSVRTLQRHVHRGEIPVTYRRGQKGEEADFDVADLEKFKERQARPTYVTRAVTPVTLDTHTEQTALVPAAFLDFMRLLAQQVNPAGEEKRRRRRIPDVPVESKLLLTVREAQGLTSLSEQALREAIRTRKLKARKIGRGAKIKRSDLDAYLKKL